MSPPVARMVRLCWPAAIRPRRDATTNTCTAAVRRVGGPGSGRERIGGKLGAGRPATKETAGKRPGTAVNGPRSRRPAPVRRPPEPPLGRLPTPPRRRVGRLGQPGELRQLAGVGHLDPAVHQREVLGEEGTRPAAGETLAPERLGEAEDDGVSAQHGEHSLTVKERLGGEELPDPDGGERGQLVAHEGRAGWDGHRDWAGGDPEMVPPEWGGR